jgi:hypothetical protein
MPRCSQMTRRVRDPSPDLQFQSSEFVNNGLQRLFHRRWKSFAITSPRRNDGKVGSERIDQLRALAD